MSRGWLVEVPGWYGEGQSASREEVVHALRELEGGYEPWELKLDWRLCLAPREFFSEMLCRDLSAFIDDQEWPEVWAERCKNMARDMRANGVREVMQRDPVTFTLCPSMRHNFYTHWHALAVAAHEFDATEFPVLVALAR